jgi:predicted nuclease of predicted toxin-antitoxin system
LEFLADESCDFAVVRALRAQGHDVIAVAEVARGAPDERVVALALERRRVLLTEDKDFGQLVLASGKREIGVILMRFGADKRSTLPSAVLQVISRLGPRLAQAFVVVKPGRVRASFPQR